jgi:hypothetical protein
MKRLILLVAMLLPITAPLSVGAPLKGAHTLKTRIGAKSHMEFEEKYQGGRRACVIAVGDRKPSVNISIAVYDDAKQLIAEEHNVDYVAAIWYPPRAGVYKVIVTNSGEEYNEMYLVFK